MEKLVDVQEIFFKPRMDAKLKIFAKPGLFVMAGCGTGSFLKRAVQRRFFLRGSRAADGNSLGINDKAGVSLASRAFLKPSKVVFRREYQDRRLQASGYRNIDVGLTMMVLATVGVWGAVIWRVGTGLWPLQ